MRITRARLAAFGIAAALVTAVPVGISFASGDEAPTAAQTQATPVEVRPASSQDAERAAQAKRIADIRAKYGVHFDHPANKDVTDPTKLLPYTNTWADVEFRGQDASGKFLSPIVKTYGNVKVRVSDEPRKEVRPSTDVPGTTITYYFWDVTVTFGDGVTYYETMYNAGRNTDDISTVKGWCAFIGDNNGKPIGKTAVDYVSTYLTEHVIYTATDPTQPRDGAMDGLPITWAELATKGMHLPA